MAQNYASKYSSKVDEVFTLESFTERAFNNDYDWDGVASINIYGIDTQPLVNYVRSGSSRYGTPNELGNTKTNYPIQRDRSFTFTIDKRNNDESMGVMNAGKALSREIREQVIPELDIYRLGVLGAASTANGADVNTGATSSSNAWTNFMALNERVSNLLVPITGRIAFMTYAYYNYLKQSGFVLASEDAMQSRHKGNLGTIEGVSVTVVPNTYMPTNTDLILTHPVAAVGPKLLEDYQTHSNPPGINGTLIEGRLVYDAHVLANKIDAIAAHKTA